MEKASRWLKGIFGMKYTPKEQSLSDSNSSDRKRSNSIAGERRLCNNPATVPPNISPSEAAWLKSYYAGPPDKEQSKHAIAVAVATAAAADAAVAAAQAAVAVVRLTSHGRGTMFSASGGCGGNGGGGREKWAAVKIQTTFRGYLAKKALRALKGLVKIQALVRGYLVRKQATATLQGMQALIRAQDTVRFKRARAQAQAQAQTHIISNQDNYSGFLPPDYRSRRSMEIFDDSRSEHTVSVHSRRLSSSFESRTINPMTEDIPKIVEVDPGRPRSSRGWRPHSMGPRSECGEPDPIYPPRSSILCCQHWHDTEWGVTGDECRGFFTAHSTPRFINSSGRPNAGPVTPSKSVCGDHSNYLSGHFGNYHVPHLNYMSNTQSFRAKVRSQSAPKQRPEPGSKKRVSLNEMMESRNSLSGVRMQRSCSQVQEAINFKNAVMGKLDRSYEFVRKPEKYYLQRKY